MLGLSDFATKVASVCSTKWCVFTIARPDDICSVGGIVLYDRAYIVLERRLSFLFDRLLFSFRCGAIEFPAACLPSVTAPVMLTLPACMKRSRPTSRSRSRRFLPRSKGRIDPSPSGFVCELATPFGTFTMAICVSPPQARVIPRLSRDVSWTPIWSCLCSSCKLPSVSYSSIASTRYNAKRRHWRRTKLAI